MTCICQPAGIIHTLTIIEHKQRGVPTTELLGSMHTLGANLALEISQLMGRVIKSTSKRSRIFLTINNIVVVYMKLISISHSYVVFLGKA